MVNLILPSSVKARSHLCAAELSAAKITIKLLSSLSAATLHKALIYFTEYILKRIENKALLRSATFKCERALKPQLKEIRKQLYEESFATNKLKLTLINQSTRKFSRNFQV